MTSLETFTAALEPTIDRLGWTLVHSLWQFAAIAVVAGIALRLLNRQSAAGRYLTLLSAMVLMMAAPIATWFVIPEAEFVASVEIPISPSESQAPPLSVEDGAVFTSPPYSGASPEFTEPEPAAQPAVSASPIPLAPTSQPSWHERAARVLEPWLNIIVAVWCCGVLLFSIRPVWSWLNVRRLRTAGTSPVSESVQQALHRVAERLQVNRRVNVLASSLVTSPIVVGCFRSVVLLPASFLANIPASQLEAILAHELAHVRRYDYLVNLLQTLAETLFFYHPAVWWLSSRIREERENCCDDLVVAALGNKVEYGRALLAVEEFRSAGVPSALVLGAKGGSLLSRVRRLLPEPSPDEQRGNAGPAALAVVLTGLLLGALWASTTADADESTADDAAETKSFVAKISDDMSVELLAIHSHSDPADIWQANGTRFATPPEIQKWRDTANRFNSDARHLIFRWKGEAFARWNGPDNTPGLTYRVPGLRMYLIPDKSGVARVIAEPADDGDVVSAKVGVTDVDWGPWQKVDGKGMIIGPVDIPPACRDAYEHIKPDHMEERVGSCLFCWSGLEGFDDRAQSQLVAVTADGERQDYDGRTAWDGPSGPEIAEVFNLPLNDIDHFEFRLRPYRHWVTFENVSLQPEKKSNVKTSVESIPVPPPDSYVAELLDGRSVELVGITKNTRPAREGWKPDGRRLDESVGEWPKGLTLHDGNTTSRRDPKSVSLDPDARDFLFRFRGLASQPSLSFELPTSGSNFSHDPVNDPYLLRVSGRLRDETQFPGSSSDSFEEVAKVAVTDRPWGRWFQVSAESGEVLNPLADDDAYRSFYDRIVIKHVGTIPYPQVPDGPAMVLRQPISHQKQYDFQIRGFDSDGEECWILGWEGRSNQEVSDKTYRLGKSLPAGRTLERFEFRLRPYLYLVTFEYVVTDGPADEPSDVKITVETLHDIDNADTVDAAPAVPNRIELLATFAKELRTAAPVDWTVEQKDRAFRLLGPEAEDGEVRARILMWFDDVSINSSDLDKRDKSDMDIGCLDNTQIGRLYITRNRAAIELWEHAYSAIRAIQPVEHIAFADLDDLRNIAWFDAAYVRDVSIDAAGDLQSGTGSPVGAGITANTKFLVIGRVPEATEESSAAERNAGERFSANLELLKAAAAKHNVAAISIADFERYTERRLKEGRGFSTRWTNDPNQIQPPEFLLTGERPR
ncbi:MAG: M56 family metallopeptidase [Planctomycetaceae bacterium]